MEKFTQKELEAKTNEELIGIIDDLSELNNKELPTNGIKAELVQVILVEQGDAGLEGSSVEFKILKTFDTIVDGERFSMTAGDVGPVPEELIDELFDDGFLEEVGDAE